MIEQQYSITRTRATWKPRVAADDLPFVKDSAGNVLVALNGDAEASYTGTGRTLVGQPPYTCLNDDAGTENEHMTFVDVDELPEGVVFDYHIDGGFNNNAVIVTWKIHRVIASAGLP